jgi:hypothetical protein
MLFNKTIADYSDNQSKPISNVCEENANLLNVKVSDIYNYHWSLKG